MNVTMLEISAQKLLDGGLVALIGIAVVFSVLAIIWLSLIALRVFLHDLPEKRKNAAPVIENTEVAEVAVESSLDEEIVAAITAAIAMAESENSDIKFKVVSFRRV